MIYHKEYILQTLPSTHPLFSQRVWTCGIMDKLKDKVLSGCGRNSQSKMIATGIPPHIMLANEVVKLEKEISHLKAEVLLFIYSIINYYLFIIIIIIKIIEILRQLPEKLKTSLLENFQVNGVIPITHTQIVALMGSMQETIIETISQQLLATNINNNNNNSSSNHNNISSNNNDNISWWQNNFNNKYKTWEWNNKVHPVPQSFEFPKCNTLTIWTLWWIGDEQRQIAPYRMIQTNNLFKKSDYQLLSRATFVIGELVNASKISSNILQKKSARELYTIFENSFVELYKILYPMDTNLIYLDKRRKGDKSYTTLYDNLKALYNHMNK